MFHELNISPSPGKTKKLSRCFIGSVESFLALPGNREFLVHET